MNEKYDPTLLAKAVLDGRLTFDAALEEHLDDKLDAPMKTAYRIMGYANMGWAGRVLNVNNRSSTVAELVKELDLTPFLPLLDRHEEFLYSLGDIVVYEGQAYQVIGRREVSPFAAPRFDDWELLIEALDGSMCVFVGEGHVEGLDDDEAVEE